MRQRPLDVSRFGPIVGEVLGLHRIDANRLVRRQRGFLAGGLDADTAERLHAALVEAGVECEVVDERLIERVARPGSAYYLDGWDEGLIVGKEIAGEIPWSRVAMIHVGAILPATADGGDLRDTFATPLAGVGADLLTAEERALLRDRTTEQPRSALSELPRWMGVVDKESFALIEDELPQVLLDVVLRDPEARYRVEAKTMIATPVGEDRSPNWLRNLWVIARRLAGYVKPGSLTAGATHFLEQSSGYDFEYDLITEYDEAVRWLWFRWRQAELDELVAEDEPAAETGAERDAAERDADTDDQTQGDGVTPETADE